MKKTCRFLLGFGLAVGIMITGIASPLLAADKPINLKFATHYPIFHHGYKNVLKPWAAEVEKRTEGRVKVTLYPNQQLGRLPEMYDALVNGTCDIAFILPVFIRGRFPLESVFHLPTLIPGDVGDPTCTAIRQMVYEKYLTPLYFKNDVKILWTGRFGLDNLLMASSPVRNLEDLKGKIIGFGGGKTPPLVLKALGAAPESIQSPDIYTSLEKKVIDGMFFPADSLRGYKLAEVVKYVTRLDFGSASNFVGIRKKAWERISPKDQKIIEDLTPWVLNIQGKSFREDAQRAVETGKKAGIEFIDLSPAEMKRWTDAIEPLDKEWVKEMDGMGLPATKLYEDILRMRGK